jgi:hypothetical protein
LSVVDSSHSFNFFFFVQPFRIDDVAIGEGGVDSTPIIWENKEPSGYFAYRKLVNEHQSEVHFVPEFIIFNGSSAIVLVKERGKPEIIIEPGKTAPLRVASRHQGLELSFNFVERDCRSPFLPVHNLGLKVPFVHAPPSGFPVGSVCVQTAIDTQGNARLVVKIGDVKFGSMAPGSSSKPPGFFRDDFVRFRVRWTELQLTLLKEARPIKSSNGNSILDALDQIRGKRHSKANSSGIVTKGSLNDGQKKADRETLNLFQRNVATVIFSRFTVDYQRIFKEQSKSQSRGGQVNESSERAQLSVIIHNLQIRDEAEDAPFPVVLDCTSDISVLDLCIRLRGPSDADLVKVDLFDLNLAHMNGQSEKIVLNTSEEFIWKLLDVTNQILAASGDFSGGRLKLQEDTEHGGFTVTVIDTGTLHQDSINYTPPKSDRLYDINLARVSPFTLLVSFRRTPQSSRYKNFSKVRGANLMNYFTKRLKFTIERAELNFARYVDRSLKGPPDRLLESLSAVYLSRMKFKLVTLISAASVQDWRFLSARDSGDDEFVEGDVLRAAGNLTGKTVGFVFSKVSSGMGDGVSGFSRKIGAGIESSTEKMGAPKLGAGVNSVVSGIGDGFGESISGGKPVVLICMFEEFRRSHLFCGSW